MRLLDLSPVLFPHSDLSKGYKGITCFVVEKEWGVQIAKKEKKVRRMFVQVMLHFECAYSLTLMTMF